MSLDATTWRDLGSRRGQCLIGEIIISNRKITSRGSLLRNLLILHRQDIDNVGCACCRGRPTCRRRPQNQPQGREKLLSRS